MQGLISCLVINNRLSDGFDCSFMLLGLVQVVVEVLSTGSTDVRCCTLARQEDRLASVTPLKTLVMQPHFAHSRRFTGCVDNQNCKLAKVAARGH